MDWVTIQNTWCQNRGLHPHSLFIRRIERGSDTGLVRLCHHSFSDWIQFQIHIKNTWTHWFRDRCGTVHMCRKQICPFLFSWTNWRFSTRDWWRIHGVPRFIRALIYWVDLCIEKHPFVVGFTPRVLPQHNKTRIYKVWFQQVIVMIYRISFWECL